MALTEETLFYYMGILKKQNQAVHYLVHTCLVDSDRPWGFDIGLG